MILCNVPRNGFATEHAADPRNRNLNFPNKTVLRSCALESLFHVLAESVLVRIDFMGKTLPSPHIHTKKTLDLSSEQKKGHIMYTAVVFG